MERAADPMRAAVVCSYTLQRLRSTFHVRRVIGEKLLVPYTNGRSLRPPPDYPPDVKGSLRLT
jgi:hypothetical protein